MYDGAPAKNLHGMEMVEDFVEPGYELFLDKHSLRSDLLISSIVELTSVSIYKHIQERAVAFQSIAMGRHQRGEGPLELLVWTMA